MKFFNIFWLVAAETMDDAFEAKTQGQGNIVIREEGKPMGEGPGSELHLLLTKIGLDVIPGCQCLVHIYEMDERGVGWCSSKEGIDTIMGWLKEEADRRKLPFSRLAASLILKQAVSNSKKKGQPTMKMLETMKAEAEAQGLEIFVFTSYIVASDLDDAMARKTEAKSVGCNVLNLPTTAHLTNQQAGKPQGTVGGTNPTPTIRKA